MQASAPAPIAAPNKPDLTKWKYAELRDTINTSTGKIYVCELDPVFNACFCQDQGLDRSR